MSLPCQGSKFGCGGQTARSSLCAMVSISELIVGFSLPKFGRRGGGLKIATLQENSKIFFVLKLC